MLHMLFLCSIRAPPIVVQNSLEVVFFFFFLNTIFDLKFSNSSFVHTYIYATFGKHDDDDATWRH